MTRTGVRIAFLTVVVLTIGIAGAGCLDTGGQTIPELNADANGTVEVHYINVGQGASTLVVGPTGETMLIDSGDFRDDGEDVINYLEENNIDRIDYLVTTHPDADHIGGHADVIEYLETQGDGVGVVYDPGITSSTNTYSDYLDAVEQYDITLYQAQAGDTIPMDGAAATVLSPPDGYLDIGDPDSNPNENSLVLRLGFGNTSFLFPGDTEDDGEAYLQDQYGDQLRSTVLKAGHHGSDSSSSGPFLDTVDPRVATISASYDNQYDHPRESTLDRFSQRDITTYWTGTHGDLVFQSNGTHIRIGTQQAAPTDPSALRDGDEILPSATDPIEWRSMITASGEVTGTVPDDGTEDSLTNLSLLTIHEDAAGDDQNNLNDEYLVFGNSGNTALNLSGWTVSDAANRTYTFPANTTIGPDETLTLRTGSGTNTATEYYWNSGSAIWNNNGDTITVTNSTGTTVLEETYS